MHNTLIIDDEQSVHQAIRSLVDWASLGLCEPQSACNGVQALELMERLQPAIVFVDMNMPMMDGVTFLSKATERFPDAQFIVVSGYDSFDFARAAIRYNVLDYLLKPIDVDELLAALAPDYIAGLTLLGGEPFEPDNQRVLLPFVRRVRETLPQKTIWAYSGFTYDGELLREGSHPRCEVTDELLSLLDVLVDGRFVLALKDISLRFRGSRNQRIIDLRKTREQGQIVLWQEPKREI